MFWSEEDLKELTGTGVVGMTTLFVAFAQGDCIFSPYSRIF